MGVFRRLGLIDFIEFIKGWHLCVSSELRNSISSGIITCFYLCTHGSLEGPTVGIFIRHYRRRLRLPANLLHLDATLTFQLTKTFFIFLGMQLNATHKKHQTYISNCICSSSYMPNFIIFLLLENSWNPHIESSMVCLRYIQNLYDRVTIRE